MCITSSDTRAYFGMSTDTKVTGGFPARRAASDKRHAVEMGVAECIPYARAR
jgi:hypothetical protein